MNITLIVNTWFAGAHTGECEFPEIFGERALSCKQMSVKARHVIGIFTHTLLGFFIAPCSAEVLHKDWLGVKDHLPHLLKVQAMRHDEVIIFIPLLIGIYLHPNIVAQ